MDDYREIENLLYRYAKRVDAGDLEGVAELFRDGCICAPGAVEPVFGYEASREARAFRGTPGDINPTLSTLPPNDQFKRSVSRHCLHFDHTDCQVVETGVAAVSEAKNEAPANTENVTVSETSQNG